MDFEELIWLFTSDKSSRGVVRLNIAEGALLYKFCKKVADGNLLEIGRKYGGSTVLMSASLNRGHLYSLDIAMNSDVEKNVGSYKNKVTFITADSKEIEWKLPLDLVFIDGDHSYSGVKSDIKKYHKYVKDNGYIVFHDIIGKKKELYPLLERFLFRKGWVEAGRADSMLVVQKQIV
jgi:predicted O-methyltransferase YrrM